MSKNTFPTQPILAIPWIKPCNLVVPILTIKIYIYIYILKKKKKLNQYFYENYKGNRDYILKSNNEITKVEQLELEIGKSVMNSVFWEISNENHREIDEKEWANQKAEKSKMKLGFVNSMINISYLIRVTCKLFFLC